MIISKYQISLEYLEKVARSKICSAVPAFQIGNDDFCRSFFMFLNIYSTILISSGEGEADIDLTTVIDEAFKELEERISFTHHFTSEEIKEYWQGTFKASQNVTRIVELAYQETLAA